MCLNIFRSGEGQGLSKPGSVTRDIIPGGGYFSGERITPLLKRPT